MRVNLTVNESLVQYVQPGFAAEIRPVGFGDRVLHGTVEKVNQYAEPTSWRQANVKEYKAFVHIDDASADLRSGMTASVTIHCADVPNAIQVPVQVDVRAWVRSSIASCMTKDSWNAREVKAGPDERQVLRDRSRAQRRRSGGDESAGVCRLREPAEAAAGRDSASRAATAVGRADGAEREGRRKRGWRSSWCAGRGGRPAALAAADRWTCGGPGAAADAPAAGRTDGGDGRHRRRPSGVAPAGAGELRQPPARVPPINRARPPRRRRGPPNEAGRQRRRSAQGLRARRRNGPRAARRVVRRARGRLHFDHGAHRFRQEHAAQFARLSRSAVGGPVSAERRRCLADERRPAGRDSLDADRLHFSIVQFALGADGRGEHPGAAVLQPPHQCGDQGNAAWSWPRWSGLASG